MLLADARRAGLESPAFKSAAWRPIPDHADERALPQCLPAGDPDLPGRAGTGDRRPALA
jgi:hypothetical protein